MTNRISTLIGSATLGAFLLGSVALADDSAPSGLRLKIAQARLKSRFANADTDHDGQLTRAEAQNGMSRVYQHFDKIDTEKKGYLTLEQIQAFLQNKSQNGQTHKKPPAPAAPASAEPQP
jgi:hypothetical protein